MYGRLEDFGQGRMSVDYVLELLQSCLTGYQSACFLNDV